MAISRMNMERQLRAGGGIMTLEEPRQKYFLGKLVKKAKRAVKKVVKSPLGKAALLAGGAYFSPMLFGKAAGFGNFGSLLKSGVGSLFKAAGPDGTGGGFLRGLIRDPKTGKFSLGRTALTGLGAAGMIAPFLMGGEEEVDEGVDVSGMQPMVEDIRNQARSYYQDPTNSGLYFMPPKNLVRFGGAFADGGLADIPRGGYAEGGIMDLGGMEKDYREGGFVPLGAEERADDVPARLSKNEFVFTADAVRNAGGGDIDKGAEVMQNMMDNLEAGGTISEESQGMNPAQEMFNQAQMLENRIV